MLLVNELPNTVCVHNEVYKCHHYEEETKVGLISQEYHTNTNCSPISNCIADAVANCFGVSNASLFVCAGQTVSIWKKENEYFMFDPHSRDSNGLQCSGGNAVLVIFCSMEGLLNHLDKLLLESRRVERSSQFEVVPISITRNEKEKDKATHYGHAETMLMYLVDQQNRNLEYQKKRKSEQASEVTVKKQKVRQTFNKTTYMKQYMREKRTNKEFVHTENKKEVQRKKILRNDEAYSQVEKERDIQRKARRRQDETFKSEENKKRAERNKERRKDEAYSQMEKERDIQRKALKRHDETFKSQENKEEAQRKKERRKDEAYNQAEKVKDIQRKALKRQDETFKSQENKKEAQRKKERRKDETYNQVERGRDIQRNAVRRQDEMYKSEENKKETQRKKERRKDETYNQVERGRDIQRKAVRRQDEMYKSKENKKETQRKTERRQDDAYKCKENKREAQRKTERREDESYKKIEKEKDMQRKRKQRNDENFSRLEAEKDCARKRRKRNVKEFREAERLEKQYKRECYRQRGEKNHAAAFRKKQHRLDSNYRKKEQRQRNARKFGKTVFESIDRFNASISDSCSYVCSCCHQLWFKQSVRCISSLETLPLNKILLEKCLTDSHSVNNVEWICTTCLCNIRKGKIPKLSVLNGMKLSQKPPELDLCNLEERLIALRIPFMQIRCLGAGGQYLLKGSVVNVPAQIEPTIRALPRPHNKTETIPVKLKRMMSMTHAVTTENIRPDAVMLALKKMMSTSELYKEANISIDERWDAFDEESNEKNETEILSSDDDSDTFSEVDECDTLPVMTLLEEPEIRTDNVISVASSEGQRPVCLKIQMQNIWHFQPYFAVKNDWKIRKDTLVCITVIFVSGN